MGLLAEAADLNTAFAEVEPLEEGNLDPARHMTFLRLRREVAYAEARADERPWREREQRS